MAFNQFVPFATGAGANALTPDQLASDPARQTGVTAGTARSILANAAWRQGTSMSSMLGAFIVDSAGQSANDDGNIPVLLAGFKAGISAIAVAAAGAAAPPSKALWHTGVASGTPSALVVNPVVPAITAYTNDQTPCLIYVPFVLAAGATINFSGIGAIPIRRADDTPIQYGDVITGDMAGTIRAGAFRLISLGRAEVQRITINPVLYVRPDGNDANDGLENSAGRAFATISAALNRGTSQFNFASSGLTIQLGAPGTYASPGFIPRGTGTVSINGDLSNQGAYTITGSASSGQGVIQVPGIANLSGLTIENTGTGSHTIAATGSAVVLLTSVTLATTQTTTGAHAYGAGGSITLGPNCIIRGNASAALFGDGGGSSSINPGAVLTVQNTPTFSTAFALATTAGQVIVGGGAVITGSANGSRYFANDYGIIKTNGGGVNFFPGSMPGSVSNSLYS